MSYIITVMRRIFILLLLPSTAWSFGMGTGTFLVWSPNNLKKVLKYDPPYCDQNPKLHFEAARNEYERAQIVIRSDAFNLKDVKITVSDLKNDKTNEIIYANQLKLFKQHYIHVQEPTVAFPIGWYPDALIPLEANQHFDINKGENQAVWVNLKTPKDISEGKYKGELRITTGQGSKYIPIELTIWDFDLTDESHSKSSFAIWENHLLAGHAEVGKTNHRSEQYYELLRNYYEFLLAYRVSPMYLPVATENVDKFVHEGASFIRDSRVTSYSIPYYPDDDAKNKALIDQLRDAGLLEKGFYYLIDEPTPKDYSRIKQLGKTLKGFAPDVSHMVTMDVSEGLIGDVDLWCTILTSFTGDYPIFLKDRQQEGDRAWWYTCVNPKNPFPSYHIDDHLIGARLLSWMQRKFNIEGNLYWAVNIYKKYDENLAQYTNRDIWNDPHAFPRANGDGFLVYPGENYGVNGPLPSVRLEAIRDGAEDYEYLWLLENKIRLICEKLNISNFDVSASLNHYYERLFSAVNVFTKDTESLLAVRREIAEEIVSLNNRMLALDTYSQIDNSNILVTLFTEIGVSVLVNGQTHKSLDLYGEHQKLCFKLPVAKGVNALEIILEKGNKIDVINRLIKVNDVLPSLLKEALEFNGNNGAPQFTGQGASVSLVDSAVTLDNAVIRVVYGNNSKHPSVKLYVDKTKADWTRYNTLEFDVFNHEIATTAIIYVKFFGADGTAYDNNYFNVRSNRKHSLEINLNDLPAQIRNNMNYINIWMWQVEEPIILEFDKFKLTSFEKDR